jgi:hypothetical protein
MSPSDAASKRRADASPAVMGGAHPSHCVMSRSAATRAATGPVDVRRWARRALSGLLAIALTGCGMGGAQPTLYRDDGYDAIQRDEAIIERERGVALGAEADACAGACRALAAICEAAERICSIAHDLREAPALERCGRARESCTESREHVARTCACRADDGASGS